jgi:hypothetical protein
MSELKHLPPRIDNLVPAAHLPRRRQCTTRPRVVDDGERPNAAGVQRLAKAVGDRIEHDDRALARRSCRASVQQRGLVNWRWIVGAFDG